MSPCSAVPQSAVRPGPAALTLLAQAQDRFPDRPLRLAIPFATGGSNHVVGRLIVKGMDARLGQTIVVENRGGAGGILGNDLVARSRPDACTLLLAGSGSFLIASLVQPRVPYDVPADFTAAGFVGQAANVVTVNPAVPARGLAELREVALRARPPLTDGSPGCRHHRPCPGRHEGADARGGAGARALSPHRARADRGRPEHGPVPRRPRASPPPGATTPLRCATPWT